MGIGIQFGDTLLMTGVLTCVVSITWIIIIKKNVQVLVMCCQCPPHPNYVGNIAFTVNIL